MFSFVNLKALLSPLNSTRRLLSVMLVLCFCLQLASAKTNSEKIGGFGFWTLFWTIVFALAAIAMFVCMGMEPPAEDGFNQSAFLLKLGGIAFSVMFGMALIKGAIGVKTGGKEYERLYNEPDNHMKKVTHLATKKGFWYGLFAIALIVVCLVITKDDNIRNNQHLVRGFLIAGIFVGAALLFVSSLMIKQTLTGKRLGAWCMDKQRVDQKKGFTLGHVNVIVFILLILAVIFTGKNSDIIGKLGGNSTHFCFIMACVFGSFLIGSSLWSFRKYRKQKGKTVQERAEYRASDPNRDTKYVCAFSVILTAVFVAFLVIGLTGSLNFELGGMGVAGNFNGMWLGFAIVAGLGFVSSIVTGTYLIRNRKSKRNVTDGTVVTQPTMCNRPTAPADYHQHPHEETAGHGTGAGTFLNIPGTNAGSAQTDIMSGSPPPRHSQVIDRRTVTDFGTDNNNTTGLSSRALPTMDDRPTGQVRYQLDMDDNNSRNGTPSQDGLVRRRVLERLLKMTM